MANAKKYFDDDGQEIFVKMKHDKHDAIAERVTLRSFDEVWSKKGWSVYDETQADVDEAALEALAVKPSKPASESVTAAQTADTQKGA